VKTETVLALDLATRFGWCEGEIGGKPRFGSERCAPSGAASPAVFGGFLKWMGTRMQAFRPNVVAYEAPLAPSLMRGKTTVQTSRILLGLPAITEAVCDRVGIYTVLEARVDDVRQHFLGVRTMRGDEAKRAVMARCRQLGLDPPDDNAADAVALWDYVCAMRNPKLQALRTPLFEKGLR
jgi:hypothetical protein